MARRAAGAFVGRPQAMTAPPRTPEWAVTRTIKLSSRYSVEMTVGPGGFTCEWSPEIPRPGSCTHKELKRYRAGRDALVAEVAQRMGRAVMLVEL